MSAAIDLLSVTAPPLRILEIGPYMGISLLTWADAANRPYGKAAEILCIDTWGDTGSGQYLPAIQTAFESQIACEIFRNNADIVHRTPGIPVTARPCPFWRAPSFILFMWMAATTTRTQFMT